jgi:protein-disulfide isomerase
MKWKEKTKMYYVEYYDRLFKRTKRKSFASALDALDYAKQKNGIVGSY